MKVVGVITESTVEDVIDRVQRFAPQVDVFEWRLDYLKNIDMTAIAAARLCIVKPLIVTLRPRRHGGNFEGSEDQRLEHLMVLAQLAPAYIDIEHTVEKRFIDEIKAAFPTINVILSYHNFDCTPPDLENIWQRLQYPFCDVYKLVTKHTTAADSLRMMACVRRHAGNIVGLCVGHDGMFTRVLTRVMGGMFSYHGLPGCQSPVPFCPDVEAQEAIYQTSQLNPHTQIYGLIGDPVEHSQGHVLHNTWFRLNSKNAVYVKMCVSEGELADFFVHARALGVFGLSVTSPLKHAVIPFMDELTEEAQLCQAVNTVYRHGDTLVGANTDGQGAVSALLEQVDLEGRRVMLFGAGGAAVAISRSLQAAGAVRVDCTNRTQAHARRCISPAEGQCFALDALTPALAPNYDIVINTLCRRDLGDERVQQLLKPLLHDQLTVMDIDYQTPCGSVRKQVESRGARFIDGQAMFRHQARMQQMLWETTPVPEKAAKDPASA